jgi:hypothetical protein
VDALEPAPEGPSFAALGISIGTVGSGTLHYETSTPPLSGTVGPTSAQYGFGTLYTGILAATIGSLTASNSTTLRASVIDPSSGSDSLSFFTNFQTVVSPPVPPPGAVNLGVSFLDATRTALSGVGLPGSVELSDWTEVRFTLNGLTSFCYDEFFCENIPWEVGAVVTSWALVPEPSVAALLALGCAALAWRRSRLA